ncbi:lipoprotein-releasing system permease protein [Cyclobacterium xiamenense]|uniref:Lipoprotein-releasing system permease protein n=1 Tax=Cyclobacterium xiamenense TaxID=1297121 RepID=A0A1H7AVY2_9BACT|nr:FtsX-like permease family protein [Cyclobacterium xiamenense]SEJ66020.1 lipoprotein-releasing system permease protein [Cyclobacterium xiamenense]
MTTNQKIVKVFLTARVKQLVAAVLSVMFGISMYVFMNSFMDGVNTFQTDITFSAMSHIKIYNELKGDPREIITSNKADELVLVSNAKNIRYTEGIKNIDEIKEGLKDISQITGIAAQLNQNVFIRNGVSKISANLSGIETQEENKVFGTAENIVQGNLYELDKRNDGVVLGTGLAEIIGVNLNDNITIQTSDGVSKVFKVVGTIETGAASLDRSRALVNIDVARQLLNKNKSYATELMIDVDEYKNAIGIAKNIQPLTKYKVEPWQEGNAQMDSGELLRNIIAIATSLTILIVAGFGIYNIMTMTVNEKIKEIAILNAMGFNSKDIIEIFLLQSIFIGFLGGVAGLVFGNIISRIIDNTPFQLGLLDSLPMNYNPKDYALAFLFGLIITFIAGYLPALRASKLDPVDTLRG